MLRSLKIFAIVLISLGALLSAIWLTARLVTERKRTEWKTEALQRLGKTPLTNDIIRTEIDQIRANTNTNDNRIGWTNDHVLPMANGEYIVYEYRHGRNDYFPPHLFLGHASNGHWLYSSYHFCNNMQMIRFDDPPASIAEFCKTYHAREFDGKSDQCLKLTD